MLGREIEDLIEALARLPGLGPRSARRLALTLLQRKERLLSPLREALVAVENHVVSCQLCGGFDTTQPCTLCCDPKRDGCVLVVVETPADMWTLERAGVLRARYHTLGGTLSALEGRMPEDLRIPQLLARIKKESFKEVILALSARIEGQTTLHYLMEQLAPFQIRVTRLAHGVPMGGTLENLDDGTLTTAFSARTLL